MQFISIFLHYSTSYMLKGDEARCNNLAKAAFYPPIYSAFVTFAIGCLLLLTMMLVEKKTIEQNMSKAKEAAETPAGAEVDKIICCVKEAREVEGNYDLLHRAEGGVRMLIGTSFTLLSSPKERHATAKYIYDKEMEIHMSKRGALRCLRRKGWSQKETYALLDHLAKPNCVKKAKHQVSLTPHDFADEEPSARKSYNTQAL